MDDAMKKINTGPIRNTTVTVPGSKSYTHRTLIAAALSDGLCRIDNWLDSEDTRYTLEALSGFGARIEKDKGGLMIWGRGGDMDPCNSPIFIDNSGTSMRLLTSYAALGKGHYVLTGSDRMHERPIQHLLDALQEIGVNAVSVNHDGCPPVEVMGGRIAGGEVHINCSISSQFLSGLLLIAPYTEQGLKIYVTHGPVSKPYIDMTLDIMSQFGVSVIRDRYQYFEVAGNQCYRSGNYKVEPDASQAGYFWAAAAITGAEIKVAGITEKSSQGDVRFAEVLGRMGCHVAHAPDGIAVKGGNLSGIEVDMADMPDIVPTFAVVAAFAKGTTTIKNVAHLKVKESDRLTAVINELTKMGISAKSEHDDLIVVGGTPHGAVIETYNDHRMAMCFAIAGLVVPGIEIINEGCVGKSFPGFWDIFGGLSK
jgi:3-phosphoshikimate 1-carboxyvinyltransferase